MPCPVSSHAPTPDRHNAGASASVSAFFSPLLALEHAAVSAVVRPGDVVVDATMGNGHDTLFLAQLVGADGLVLAFDVQQAALDATIARLEAAGLRNRALLFHKGHEHAAEHLAPLLAARPTGMPGVTAIMFNLGFLPGSNRHTVTAPAQTLAACEALLPYLLPGGMLSLHLYTGHPGGQAEASTVQIWAAALPWPHWQVLQHTQANKPKNQEHVVIIHRAAAGSK